MGYDSESNPCSSRIVGALGTTPKESKQRLSDIGI